MKVILLQDVKKQGKKDDIIDVSDGYANNYLIKNKLAVAYSKKSMEVLKQELDTRALNEEKYIEECNKLKNSLKDKELVFYLNSGKNGKTFGSVSLKQISEELKKMGINIDKKCIHLDHQLDTLGTHLVKVELHKKVVFDLKVVIKER